MIDIKEILELLSAGSNIALIVVAFTVGKTLEGINSTLSHHEKRLDKLEEKI